MATVGVCLKQVYCTMQCNVIRLRSVPDALHVIQENFLTAAIIEFGAPAVSVALNCFYDGVDIHVMIPDADSRRSTLIEQVRVRLAELWSYLTANQTRLINYGREYREGHRISTARVGRQTDGLYLEATLQAHQKLRTLLFSSPALAVLHEHLHRLIKLLNL